MKKGIFVTGTDTNAGKTFVCKAILQACARQGLDAGYMKPVSSGCRLKEGQLLSPDAEEISQAGLVKENLETICPIRYELSASPYQASLLEGKRYSFEKIQQAFDLIKNHDYVIVEGIGGLCVPLTETEYVYDLVAALQLPLIITAANRIGVINHSLLTIETAQSKGLDIRGIILSRTTAENGDITIASNAEELSEITQVPVLGNIPFIGESADSAAFIAIDQIFA